jgi:hypothetical protein
MRIVVTHIGRLVLFYGGFAFGFVVVAAAAA